MDVTVWVDRLVTHLKQQGAIRSPDVEGAFRRVPRHRLLGIFYRLNPPQPGQAFSQPEAVNYSPTAPAPVHLDTIYSDTALVTRISRGIPSSSTSLPSLMADMLETLELKPGLRVLEVGAGTGYNAALMAELVGDQALVVSVDIQEDLVVQAHRLLAEAGYPAIKLLVRDGFYGVPEEAPYDRIVATVGCPDLSPRWAEQLTESGFMLVPITHGGSDSLMQVWLEGGILKGKVVGITGFMNIEGELATEEHWPFGRMAPSFGVEARELPFFDGLQADDVDDFHYFVALQDSRTFWGSSQEPTCGIFDRQLGAIRISPQKARVILTGDEQLYHELQQLYFEWRHLGKPNASDYGMEFLPITEPPSGPSPVGTIQRKFYRQVVTL